MSEVMTESKKKEILKSYRELDMHKELRILFENIYKQDTNVYYTHGPEEYGRDIIISENRPLQKHNTSCVIKMDKLSGKTLDKNIMDIVFQVKQCFEVDYKVKEETDTLKTDYVFIIVFGEISNQALTNLELHIKEYQGRYKIFDITELTELFSKHYPGVFMGASGFEALTRKFDELEEALIKKNKLLTSSYIEPNLKSYQKSVEELVALTSSSDQKRNSEAIAENIFGKKETIQSFINKIENHHLNILVDGDAGSGKTVFAIKLLQSLIKKLVNDITSNRKETTKKNLKVPVLINATSLKNGNIKRLNEYIEKFYIDASYSFEPSLIVIDGLDEVGKKDRENIVGVATKYCKGKCSLIFTSRKSTSIKKMLKSFLKYELLEFESSQVINFIKKVLEGNEILIQSLLKGIEQLKNQIPMYPMSLALLIEIAQTQKEVPASISELYSKYIELVIGDKSNEEDSIHILFEPKIKFDFLNIMAYKLFYKNNTSVIKREIFDKYLEDYVLEHSHINSVEDFLHEISRLTIVSIDEYEVKFLHKSFLDYFVAQFFINEYDVMTQEEHEDIYRNFYSSLWEDVTSFYFGIKSKISQIQIDRILAVAPIDEFNKLSNFEEKDNPLQLTKREEQNFLLIESLSKFQLGKLIQYAWNTKNETKAYALQISTKESLKLKEQMHRFQDEEIGMKLPLIASDATMLHFIDLFYSSIFVEKEIEKLVISTMENIKNIDKESLSENEMLQSMFYFSNLYILVNAKRLSPKTLNFCVKTLIEEEEKIPPKLSLIIFGLFNIFKDNKKSEIEKKDLQQIDSIAKKLTKKYRKLAIEIFQFKSKIDLEKINSLRKRN